MENVFYVDKIKYIYFISYIIAFSINLGVRDSAKMTLSGRRRSSPQTDARVFWNLKRPLARSCPGVACALPVEIARHIIAAAHQSKGC